MKKIIFLLAIVLGAMSIVSCRDQDTYADKLERERKAINAFIVKHKINVISETLQTIERMPETTFDEIMDKYVEMNVAHPFMEGNGRSTRIWLDLMLKRSLKRCVDWSQIDKNEYLSAMRESVADSAHIKALVQPALTTKIDDREIFMKGIDYSYYYEQE